MDTNTNMPTPTCENCGRDKTATYICDGCCNKLNTASRALIAERDRLAAENAELRESLAEYAHAVGAGHPSPCTLGPLCPYCHIDGIDEQLAAANATLDKLRDLLPEGGVWCYACNRATVPVWGEEPYEHIDPKYNQMKTTFRCSICKRDTHAKDSCVDTLRAILHPTPENNNEH